MIWIKFGCFMVLVNFWLMKFNILFGLNDFDAFLKWILVVLKWFLLDVFSRFELIEFLLLN